MALNSCKENVHPKWRLSRPEGKERHLKEGDFKQWDVKCHKVSLNKSYHFSYPFFWNCPWVNDLLNRNSILQRRSQAPFKTNPKLQSSIAAFCCQPGMEKNHLKSLKRTSAAEWIIHAMKISEMPVLDRKSHAFAGLIFPAQFQCQTFVSILYFYHQNTEADNHKHVIHQSSLKVVSLTPINPIPLLIYEMFTCNSCIKSELQKIFEPETQSKRVFHDQDSLQLNQELSWRM